MSKTWVTADPHFSHANILTFTRNDGTPLRPFKNVEEMNETLIENWNSVVGNDDRVYLLGDVAFHPRVFQSVIPRLKGRICLVPGNHEPPKMRKYFDLFDDVRGYVVKHGVIMSHIPIHPGSLSRWQFNVHGHLHANKVQETIGTGTTCLFDDDPRYICVSVEHTNYTPLDLQTILDQVK